jgi:hypothetical protein
MEQAIASPPAPLPQSRRGVSLFINHSISNPYYVIKGTASNRFILLHGLLKKPDTVNNEFIM